MFFLADFMNLPFKNNFFNLVVHRASVTHNTINNIKEIIKNIYNKLKKKGIYIGTFWSDKCSEKKYGKKIFKQEFLYKINRVNFEFSPIVTFFNKHTLRKIMYKFKIADINYVRRTYKKLIVEEIILVAKKN